MGSARPALSFWQRTAYAYQGYEVDSVFKLGNLTGFVILDVWREHLSAEFAQPKIIELGVSLRRGILLSSAAYLSDRG